MSDFEEMFQEITEHKPYPWQARLYRKFSQGIFPRALDIPTGLGKTSVMTIWLLALAARTDHAKHIPTRLVYMVDRRAIVDQASDEALQIQSKLTSVGCNVQKLNVSSLRGGGGSADGREWLMEPHVPSIIVGTIDMIGSRLLFSGYGVGRNTRPLYAGMLGQDSLIILDETHLSPAMEKALLDVHRIAEAAKHMLLPPRVMFMSATQRSGHPTDTFTLNSEDKKHEEIKKRYESEKFLSVVESSDVTRRVADEALRMNGRVLVYLQKPKDVQKVSAELRKLNERVVTLTGTMRGFERDQLAQNNDYAKFGQQKLTDGRCFLISTSAGEVGVDLDADNMVCDITTLDSIIQRLGRVNRSGGRSSQAVVVYSKDRMGKGIMKKPLETTLSILQGIANGETHNANPAALGEIEYDIKMSAFAPTPETQPLTQDILDMWSMTSLYQKYTSRPSVQYWLHGKPESHTPETYVVWRDDVEMLTELGQDKIMLEILDKYRILPHEMARGPSREVHRILQTMDNKVAVVQPDNTCIIKRASEISESEIAYATVLLPCAAGGLGDDGILGGTKRAVCDVADEESSAIRPHTARDTNKGDVCGNERSRQGRRARIVVSSDVDGQYQVTKAVRNGRFRDVDVALDEWLDRHPQMTLAYSMDLKTLRDEDGDEDTEEIRYYVKMQEQQESTAPRKQRLDEHHSDVEEAARQIVNSLGILEQDMADAVVTAARIHDKGKAREHWQRCMRVAENDRPLAKTGRRIRPLHLGGFRHEFASVVDASLEVAEHPERDLILHLVAAHHGWARPCFRYDTLMGDDPADELYRTMSRYTRLQCRFGPWGLAWMEGLLRGADWTASAARNTREMER